MKTNHASSPRRRAVSGALGLAAATLLVLGLLTVPGLVGYAQPGKCMPWDRVPLKVSSMPGAADVYVEGRRIGTTPADAVQCRGTRLHVRVARAGYRSWEWTGLLSGPTELEARLLAESEVR